MSGEAAARAFAGRRHGVVIGGDGVTAARGDAWIAVEDPATEEQLAEVPLCGSVTVDRAVATARRAFADGRWSSLDPDAALDGALAGAFENCGQACIAGSRLLVERGAHEEVVARIAERARTIAIGPGWREGTELGPLVSAAQRERVLGYVAEAVREGADLVTDDPAIDGPGHFVRPAVVGEVTRDMRIFREEVFGPVVTVTPFDDQDEAVALANDTRYGLAAAVWTRDGTRALAVARRIRAGTVWVNAYGSIRPEVPFGGFGDSGLGRELGADALAAYTEPKSMFVAL